MPLERPLTPRPRPHRDMSQQAQAQAPDDNVLLPSAAASPNSTPALETWKVVPEGPIDSWLVLHTALLIRF